MSSPWNWPCPQADGADLLQRLSAAEQTIRRLSDRIGLLERQLDEVRSRTPLHVEYHFDQLKVNELKGTLNVGLSPQGIQGIDSFETPVGTGSWQVTTDTPGNWTDDKIGPLQQQMSNYMDRESHSVLAGMEHQFGIDLGASLRRHVLHDVRKQLNDRVHYYAKTTAYPENGSNEERRQWGAAVIEKTKRDAEAAFLSYLSGYKASLEPTDGGNSP